MFDRIERRENYILDEKSFEVHTIAQERVKVCPFLGSEKNIDKSEDFLIDFFGN
jgi:hypothetical protein